MSNDPSPDVGSSIDSNADDTETEKPTPEIRLSASLASLARAHGFRFFWIGTFPSADNPGLFDNRIADNWPNALSRLYDASGAFYASRLITTLRETIVPVFEEISAFEVGRRHVVRSLWPEFQRQGFQRILALSLYGPHGQRFLAIFTGKSEPTANLAAIQYDLTRFIDAYSREPRERAPGAKMLGRRETECLRWAAAGKSSEEIALILEISPHTVNYYLASAARKLACVNRMHTIARALRLRLI